MLYFFQHKNDRENFIRLYTGEVVWSAAFDPVRVWHTDGQELLRIPVSKKPWWKFFKGLFEFEVTLIAGKAPENYYFVAKGWFNGHWQIRSATQTFDLFRHTGHYTDLYCNGEKVGVIDLDEKVRLSGYVFRISFREEYQALLLIAFVMNVYLADTSEGRHPIGTIVPFKPKNRP